MDLIAKSLGLVALFYMCRAGAGRDRERDFFKFVLLLAAFYVLIYWHKLLE